MSEPVLAAKGVVRHFGGGRRLLARAPLVRAVDGVSLDLHPGRTLGLVGESGSGKSTLGRVLVGLLEPTAGEVRFHGRNLRHLDGESWRSFRRSVQYVFQDPSASFNPRSRIRTILEAPLRHLVGLNARDRSRRAADLLERVGMAPAALERYPHEFSGGQGQRIAIARALAPGPEVLVLDEPTSALDVSVQAQILELLARLQDDLGVAYLFISHDLTLVEQVADEVIVLREGVVVEGGPRERIFRAPEHPYTRALLRATPELPPVPGPSPVPERRPGPSPSP